MSERLSQKALLRHIGRLEAEQTELRGELADLRRKVPGEAAKKASLVRRLPGAARHLLVQGTKRLVMRAMALLPSPRFRDWTYAQVRRLSSGAFSSPQNSDSIDTLVRLRQAGWVVPRPDLAPANDPAVDITVVTYNDERWVEGFVRSLLALEFDLQKITITIVDHGSTDATLKRLDAHRTALEQAGIRVRITKGPNRGYGAGHNSAARVGSAPFLLITNIDIEFDPGSLRLAAQVAAADRSEVAAWEFRQLPYEHPKYYDPVTGLTNWNAHACVLVRRAAFEAAGGYDESIFMYGEDVDLSYRLRQQGHYLRYLPRATIRHFSYKGGSDIRPLQFSGATLASYYLRLKYGKVRDLIVAPVLLAGVALHPGVPSHLRPLAWKSIGRALSITPKAIASRRPSAAKFPFRRFDYEMIRDGAAVALEPPGRSPLVTVVTRTVAGREKVLRQAAESVNNQTYGPIEHLIVRDGDGPDLEALALPTRDGLVRRLISGPKAGRSLTGNRGLSEARGRYCLFLDDDDLLFADHIEVLVAAIGRTHAAAAYSLAWEVPTAFVTGDTAGYREVGHFLPAIFRQEFSIPALRHHNYIPIQSILFERRLFLERGGFEDDMEALEDWVLWNKYATGSLFTHVPKTTSMHRVPADAKLAASRFDVLNRAYADAADRIRRDEKIYGRGLVTQKSPGRKARERATW